MKRQRSLQVADRNAALLRRIQELKTEHPFWGYRRVWAYLRFVESRLVNKKRILRRMRGHHPLVTPTQRLKVKRTPTGSNPRPTKPNEWWGIGMTKVLRRGFGWGHIVAVLDWYTKAVVGYDAGLRCASKQWLEALWP